jgi:hypothetical protein
MFINLTNASVLFTDDPGGRRGIKATTIQQQIYPNVSVSQYYYCELGGVIQLGHTV